MTNVYISMLACSSPVETRNAIFRILETTSHLDVSIHLLNNGGGTEVRDALSDLTDKIHVVESESNIGVARGRNVLLKDFFRSDAEYIVNIDNDVFPGIGWLDALIKFNTDDIAITAPLTNHTCNKSQRISIPSAEVEEFDTFCRESKFDNRTCKNTEYPIGFCTCVRRRSAEIIGYYDENYRFYGNEDADYHFTAQKLKYESLLVGSSIVYHFGSKGLHSLTQDQQEEWNASRGYFAKKWGFET
jgi:GT2 family glycosyltransferase